MKNTKVQQKRNPKYPLESTSLESLTIDKKHDDSIKFGIHFGYKQFSMPILVCVTMRDLPL